MKLIQSILVIISILLFFIGCTAWPALVPPPSGKTKTAVYPIPLPATSTTAPIRITGPTSATNSTQVAYSDYRLAFSQTLQLGAIDKDNVNITSQITSWSSSTPAIATVSSTGLVTSLSTAGETTITATHPTLTPAGTLKLTVSAIGTSILAFDGKEFKELNFIPTQVKSEDK